MTRVRHAEMRALVKALETLYRAADLPSLAERVTRCLRELFDCELAFLDLTDVPAVRSFYTPADRHAREAGASQRAETGVERRA